MSRLILVFACAACLVGCKGPPVQDMSDARQAIAAARAAGAADLAPIELKAAQNALAAAESDIQLQRFTRARLAAQDAKLHAGAALTHARQSSAPPATQ